MNFPSWMCKTQELHVRYKNYIAHETNSICNGNNIMVFFTRKYCYKPGNN